MDESTIKSLVNALGKYKDVYSKKELHDAILHKGYDTTTADTVVKRIYAVKKVPIAFELPKFAFPIFIAIVLALIAMIALMAFPGVETTIPEGQIGAIIPDTNEVADTVEEVPLPPLDEAEEIEETVGELTYTNQCMGESVIPAVQNAKRSSQFIGFSSGCNFISGQTLDTSEIRAALDVENVAKNAVICYDWWPEDSFEVTGTLLKSVVSTDIEVVFKAECGIDICLGQGDSCSISKYFDPVAQTEFTEQLEGENQTLDQSLFDIDSIILLFKQRDYAAITPRITEELEELEPIDANITAAGESVGNPDAVAKQRLKYEIAYYRLLALQSIANLNDVMIDDVKLDELANSTLGSYETAYPIVIACETAHEELYTKMSDLKENNMYASLYDLDGIMQIAQDTQFSCLGMRDLTYNAEPDMRKDTLMTRMAMVLETAQLKD